MILKKRSL